MSTLKTANIANLAGTSRSVEDILGATPRAWVNFNGTGTVAIRASYNVNSITDNGAGDYTVNFTNPLQDASYAVVGDVYIGPTGYGSPMTVTSMTASAFRCVSRDISGSPIDNQYAMLAFLR